MADVTLKAIDEMEPIYGGLAQNAVMTMPPERMEIAGVPGIGAFFGSVPQDGRLDEIRLVPTATNRQPALAAYARGDDGKHHPYGLMVLQVDGQLISAIFGFPDPWLFELCGLPAELSQAAVAGPMTTAAQAGRTRSQRRPFP
jgi:RNA polymerase sigma-70 factor (ECF subfamily)